MTVIYSYKTKIAPCRTHINTFQRFMFALTIPVPCDACVFKRRHVTNVFSKVLRFTRRYTKDTH